MATVKGPLLSLDARKSIGGALTFSGWKGIQTCRLLVTPSNPKSTGQMHARALLAGSGKVSKVFNPTSDEAVFLRGKTPSGQSYISYFAREVLGTQNVNVEAAIAAYDLPANAAVKAFFDAAATDISLESVDLDGTANTQVAAGAMLWAAYEASRRLGSTNAPVAATTASEVQVDAYAAAISEAAV